MRDELQDAQGSLRKSEILAKEAGVEIEPAAKQGVDGKLADSLAHSGQDAKAVSAPCPS